MKANGTVIYKGIEKREGGIFKNDKGQDIKYDASYVIKFDEEKDGNINERKLKFPASNSSLAERFKSIACYTKVNLVCDVNISANSCRLVPVEVAIIK